MKSNSLRFLLILMCHVIMMIVLTLLIKNFTVGIVSPYWSLLLLFFSIISIFIYFMTMKVKSKKDFRKFTNFYMGTTIVKILVYIAIILTYILVFPEDRKSFIFTFFTYYLCFTIFETYILVKK